MLVNGRAAISYRLRKLIVRPREHTRRNTRAARPCREVECVSYIQVQRYTIQNIIIIRARVDR